MMAHKDEEPQLSLLDRDLRDLELDALRQQVQDQKETLERLIMLQHSGTAKRTTKARDIPILELHHLHGLESASRLNLFFEQVESCSLLSGERIEVAKLRVSVELAMRLQALIAKESIQSWDELKTCLRKEFATEVNFDRAWQHIDNMKYDWVDSPQAFVN